MKVNGILESALYFDNLQEAANFYQNLFELESLVHSERLIALNIADKQVLLLFKKAGSLSPIALPGGGVIPPHDGSGPVHLAFSINHDAYEGWLAKLAELQIEVESTVDFNEGRSIYFRDPGNHLVELATPESGRARLTKQRPGELVFLRSKSGSLMYISVVHEKSPSRRDGWRFFMIHRSSETTRGRVC